MTEEKKTLSPGAKRLIAYMLYAAVCVAACSGAAAVQQMMRHQTSLTFVAIPYTMVVYAAYAVLGMLWAGELFFALKVRRIAVLVLRLIAILVLLLLSIGWAVVGSFGGTMPQWLYSAYANGGMPAFAVAVGWLMVSTVFVVFRRAEKE